MSADQSRGSERNWRIQLRNSYGEWLDVRQLDGYEIRLQVGQPDRLFLEGAEVGLEWRVFVNDKPFSRDSRMRSGKWALVVPE